MWLEHNFIGKAEASTEKLLRGPAALISSSLKRPEKMLIIQPVDIWDSHLLNELQFLSPEEKETNIKKKKSLLLAISSLRLTKTWSSLDTLLPLILA